MATILIGLTFTTIIAVGVLLAVLQAGIRQQERAGSLDRQPPGLSAALARRVFGLHAHLPGVHAYPPGSQARPARRTGQAVSGPALVPGENRRAAS
jgi:hypothetical protein